MAESAHQNEKARAFFEDIWRRGDFWEIENSPFEQARSQDLLSMLSQPRYGKVLELGCGAGSLTCGLARRAERIVAVDIAPSAIERALRLGLPSESIDFRVENIMEFDAQRDGPWDLIVLSETM
jgi:methylase of polypeptide subunit release factors